MANSNLVYRSSITTSNIKRSVSSLGSGLKSAQRSTGSLQRSILKRNDGKRQAISNTTTLFQKRRESVRRREEESIVEAGSVFGGIRTAQRVVMNSTKGFLGRILDYIGTLMVGWAVVNLPTIIKLGQELGDRIQKVTGILSNFMTDTGDFLLGFGQLLGGAFQNLISFDFTDSQNRVSSALESMRSSFNKMEDAIYDSIVLLTKPFDLGEKEQQQPGTPGTQQPGTQQSGAPTPTNQRGNYGNPGEGAVRQYAANQGYSPEFTAGLLSTVKAESGFNPYAIGDSGASYGLFQFNNNAGRRQPFLNFLEKNGVPNPYALFQNPDGPSAKKYRNQVFGLTLEYMMENEQGSQIVRDYKNSKDLRTIMGGFEDIEGYSGSQTRLPRNRRNNPKYNSRLSEAQSYLKSGTNPPAQTTPASTKPVPGTQSYKSGTDLTQTIGKGVGYITIGDVMGAPRGSGKHKGIDIQCPANTCIALRVDSEVVFAGWQNPRNHNEGYGLVIDMWVPELGVQLRFGHCAGFFVTGGKVKAGHSFARVGSTGNSTGPHIHFEYTRTRNQSSYGSDGDPSPYIPYILLTDSPNRGTVAAPDRKVLAASNIGIQQGKNTDSLKNERKDNIIAVPLPSQQTRNRTSMLPMGGAGISIPTDGGLNRFVTQKLLLDLAYT